MSKVWLNKDQYGDYVLVKELGRGSSATIFLARPNGKPENVVVKIFHPHIFQDPHFALRINREFKILTSLENDNIVKVRDFLSDNDPPALVMDYVDGHNLEKFQGRLPYVVPEISALIVIEVLKALEYAHSRQLIHRDIKPENILISQLGHVFLTDFGLAKVQESGTFITQANHVVGTADFMSPEQAAGESVGPTSDLFSVGAVFYFLTTGTRPFNFANIIATLSALRSQKPEAPEKRNPKISGPLSKIIQKGLTIDPSQRYQTASEFRKALEDYLTSLGLTAENFRLPLWMAEPSGFAKESIRTITENLVLSAERSIKEKRWNDCLELVGHLSLKSPENPAIPKIMAQLRASHRERRLSASLVAVVAAAFLIVSSYAVFRVKKHAEVVAAPQSPAPVLSEVRFHVPDSIEVFWDGQKVDSHLPLKEKTGDHEVLLRRNGTDLKKTISVKPGEPVEINVQ